MNTETLTDLNDSTISGLQKLIRYNIDSRDGFREAAGDVSDPILTSLFRDMERERGELVTELQDHVQDSGEQAEDDGSVMAAVHRVWIKVRAAVNAGDPYPILCEAEKGEDYIKAAYEDVLKETAGSAVNDVLTRQYAKVKAGHDRVRDIRDSFKVN